MRVVHLPAVGRTVSVGAYVRAVKRAKAEPDREFRAGLDCWWPATGAEIVRQYRRAMHQRISDAAPYSKRGAGHPEQNRSPGTDPGITTD